MGARCFMVDSVLDCFTDEPGPLNFRVGAMAWRSHGRNVVRDVAPRPMPHLSVMTPAGLVCLDCPASLPQPPGQYWTRTGDPPDITVTPSLNINDGQWHGWLTNGELVG